MAKLNLDAKTKFNCLSDAKHIFALKEDGTLFKVCEIIESGDETKVIAIDKETGEFFGIFTDSRSARNTMKDVHSAFGDDQPFIKMNIKETKKGQTVYYATVED